VNVYGQDQWKATPNFSVTLGLRYDLDIFPSGSDVRVIGKMNAINYGNVQPPRWGCILAQRRESRSFALDSVSLPDHRTTAT
jgi:outer membrane receptor protein involved in Fe transport